MNTPPPDREPGRRPGSTALKVVGGLVAFFALLCVGFVFFIAVVCGVK